MTDLYCVVGNPIAHSKSPRIHALFAEQTGQDLRYEARLVELDAFAQTIDRYRQEGVKGLNVTVPFKRDAWAYATERSERAERAGAVNTLVLREDGTSFGDTTDGIGLVRDLRDNLGLELTGKRLLLLGAGGAVRGVLEPLLMARPSLLIIANRTVNKAIELARDFCGLGRIEGCGFPDLAAQSFDLVINGTAAGLTGKTPPIPAGPVTANTFCYDMMYGSEPTPFVRWARAQGAQGACDGLGMLVEQAAESFRLWRGVRPETAPVIQVLREEG